MMLSYRLMMCLFLKLYKQLTTFSLNLVMIKNENSKIWIKNLMKLKI